MKNNQNNGRMYRCSLLCVVLFSLSVASVRATGTVVQNGGFELGSFPPWTLSGNTLYTGVENSIVHSGIFAGAFGSETNLGYLSQTLTTVPGQEYRLSFWLLANTGLPTTEFNVAWNGGTLIDLVNQPAAGWSNYVFTVTATSSSTVLQFGFRNDPNFFYLDDVSVIPVEVGLTFDDLGDFVAVTNGYGGLNWSGVDTVNPVTLGTPSGYLAGMVSSSNVVFDNSNPCSITSANTFNLYSAYLTSAWYDNLQFEAKGYTGGVLVYDTTNTLSATNRTLINFNYLGVTEVDFIASGGTQHAGYTGSGEYFAMDNVNVTTGPGVESNPQLSVPLPGPLMGPSAYVRSTNGEPWGQSDNIVAMNNVFGSNAWQSLYFETVNPATLFSPTVHSVFIDGSNEGTPAFNTFLSANLSTMQSWVSNGGSLFLNLAPVGYGIAKTDLGFGVVANYENYTEIAAPVNLLNPIFNGPFLPVGTNWTGSAFAHATVFGAGLIPVIVNSNDTSQIVLGEMQAGSGHVLFGGMTIPFYHSPQPQSANLLANVLAYMNNSAEIVFDDLPAELGITNGYRGLLWSNFTAYADAGPSGYHAGTVSANNIAFNGLGNPAAIKSTTPFNFVSAWLTAAWNDNLQVEVRGYAHGLLAYDQTYVLSATAPTLIVFNYLGVTEVDFISSGGTKHTGYSGNGTHFAMDNVTAAIAAAPELTITPGAGSAVVSWSSPSIGWSLQQSTSMTNGSWTSPPEIINDGGTNQFIDVSPLTGTNEFYRLIYQ